MTRADDSRFDNRQYNDHEDGVLSERICAMLAFELVTSSLFSPPRAGTEIELMLARPPTTDTDSDEIDDLASMARCR